jgi:hypothetical protein
VGHFTGGHQNTDFLGLNDCQLEGTLPSELGNLWNMTRLQIKNNYFSGTIPSTLGTMTNLELLAMEGNELTGAVPQEMCALRQQKLQEFITECFNSVTNTGVTCDVPDCCTLCRNSGI